jgi:phosphoribosylformylglycinamidine cyclo-ligase
MPITYEQSGVDRDKGDAFVSRIQKLVKSTYGKEVKSGVGGFASLFDVGGGKYLAAGTDGVGTKLRIAQALNKHDTIGIDLVAMCANDVICTGARPLFFLDYIGCGKLDLAVSEAIVEGIVHACRDTKMALVGGETAEMPGMYPDGDYDLAGFCVGEVKKSKVLDGKKLKVGDQLVAITSSGAHSNGYSLLRKLIKTEEKELMFQALTPTKLYVKSVLAALEKKEFGIKGCAHITGSGFHNIPRINAKFGYHIDQLPPLPKFFELLQARAELDDVEMYSTFNMGIGFVFACSNGEALVKFLKKGGEDAHLIGEVVKKPVGVTVKARGLELQLQ